MRNCVLVVVPGAERAGNIARALSQSGWWASVAASGTEALRRADILSPDIILLEASSDRADIRAAAALKYRIDKRRAPAGKSLLIVLAGANVDEDSFMGTLQPDLVLRSDVPTAVLRNAVLRLARHDAGRSQAAARVGLVRARWRAAPTAPARSTHGGPQ
ncbi:MAG TPA: hypothetical protein VHG09_07635 [Longimicrobiales bacterium]|nr:hypothetical protein [Longimicrobiales bacterium]